MKKKNLIIKDHVQREKTPDLTSVKTKKNRKAVAPITPSGSTTNIRKKINVANAPKNPINIYASTADIHNTEQAKKVNKAKIQKKVELNKTFIEPKKEKDIKKEYKTINPNAVKAETRSKSAAKRPIKHKNKDKDKNKKEEIKKDDIKKVDNDNNKKEEIKKVDNKNEDIKKEENIQTQKNNINNNDANAPNKDLTYKQKLNQAKKAINDPQRRKSIDLPIKKVIKKNNKETTENTKTKETRETRDNRENRENRENSMKKRKPEINTQKTPNKIKNINYNNKSKDIAPLKTGKSGERGEFKFGVNRNKKQIMNKTPDAGRMKNRKNSGGNENNAIKKPKYGNVDIKSIVKDSTKTNENEHEKNNNIEKISENNNNIKEEKKIHYRKIRNKKYDSNYLECLHLALNSGFFNPNKKLKIIINSKELYSNLDRNKIIKELIDYYTKIGNQNIINIAKNNKNKYDIKNIYEPFKPHERSINAMNFLDKSEEQKLINEVQHPYISELFKAVIILLNEYKNTDENKNIFEYFFNDLLPKYKAKNIKKLMINQFVDDRLIISDEQFELIQKMLLVKPDLFSPATLLRYNRAVAYFSFFIKELIDYYTKIGNENIINSAKNNKNKYDMKKINEPFKPNERSINAMNFLDKNEELKLINEVQHPYITELFKAVIILLNEYKNTDENKNIFEFFSMIYYLNIKLKI